MTLLNDPQKILPPEDFYSLNQRLGDYQNFANKLIQVDINTSASSSPSANLILITLDTTQKTLQINPDSYKFLLPVDTNTYFQTKDYTGLVNETQENIINYLQDPKKFTDPQPGFQLVSGDLNLGLLVLVTGIVWLTYFRKRKLTSSN